MRATRRVIVLSLLTLIPSVFTSVAHAQKLLAQIGVEAGVGPNAIGANTATNKIFLTNGNRNITVLDSATDSIIATIPTGLSPSAIAANSTTNKMYATNQLSNDVTVVNGATYATRQIPVGTFPNAVAINATTNKIYVADRESSDVAVIDGSTDTVITHVQVGAKPVALAINAATNKIYVANSQNGTVSVIDGATNSVSPVTVGAGPDAVAIDSTTNKIYVANFQSNTVTVIDGATNGTTSVNVGVGPSALAVNPITNRIYSSNNDNTVTEINGADDVTFSIPVGTCGCYKPIVADPETNKIYVSDGTQAVIMIDGITNTVVTTIHIGTQGTGPSLALNGVTGRVYATTPQDRTLSVIEGAASNALRLLTLTPCRIVDTRQGTAIQGGTSRDFVIPGTCGIPTTATAFSLNFTVVPHGKLRYLTVWPTGLEQPVVSTLNSFDGRVKANAGIIRAGTGGAISAYVTDTTDLIIDVDGYFDPATNSDGLQFFNLTPCRIVDTRTGTGNLAGPFLTGGKERDFPVLESPCIPKDITAVAYSFNVTAVPHPAGHRLGWLTVWPQGEQQPVVSTLNNPTGTVVANAAIVPAGTNGGVAVFPKDDTDLLIDINGYFAAPGAGGLSFYPTVPCRVIDTRKVGNGQPFMGQLQVPVNVSVCQPPDNAQAYVFNATVIPPGPLGFLTLWAHGQTQPVVSTLNARDGAVANNMAIVPSTDGSVEAFASALTQMLLDISGYFAP